MHLVDCFEPTSCHVQPGSHLPDNLERFACCFEAFALGRMSTWILHNLRTHISSGVHPWEVDAIDAHECHGIDGESDDGRFNKHVPLLAGSN
jgi:hypothetical protein